MSDVSPLLSFFSNPFSLKRSPANLNAWLKYVRARGSSNFHIKSAARKRMRIRLSVCSTVSLSETCCSTRKSANSSSHVGFSEVAFWAKRIPSARQSVAIRIRNIRLSINVILGLADYSPHFLAVSRLFCLRLHLFPDVIFLQAKATGAVL